MAKIFTYMVIVIGLMALFYVSGVTPNTGATLGQNNITNVSSLGNFKLFNYNTVIENYIRNLGIGALVGITIGLIVPGIAEIAISSAIAIAVLYSFIGDLISIATTLSTEESWIGWLMFLIIVPLVFGYVIALWDWIRGRD